MISQLVIVSGRLAQCVANLVLGLVVANVGPPPILWVLANQSDSSRRLSFDGFEDFYNDGSLIVFGACSHVAGDVFSY